MFGNCIPLAVSPYHLYSTSSSHLAWGWCNPKHGREV